MRRVLLALFLALSLAPVGCGPKEPEVKPETVPQIPPGRGADGGAPTPTKPM